MSPPPNSAWGFQYDQWTEGRIRIICDLAPMHLNPSGTVHGGVLLTLMDEAGALAGVFSAEPAQPRYSVTVSLTGQFTGQARSGRITAIGTVVRSGGRIYFSRSEVTSDTGELLAFGSSTHRFRTALPPTAAA